MMLALSTDDMPQDQMLNVSELRSCQRHCNLRPAGVFGQTRPAGGGGWIPPPPLPDQERVAVARWARRQTETLDEYFLSKFLKFS